MTLRRLLSRWFKKLIIIIAGTATGTAHVCASMVVPVGATGTVGAVVRAIFAPIVGAGAVLDSGGACGAMAADR